MACATMKGPFPLSSYPEEILMEDRTRYGWKSEDHLKALCVDGRRKEAKTKWECLTWNY
ncbi:hypothetical protein GCM10027275_10100 [Rhabdobacter roseus]